MKTKAQKTAEYLISVGFSADRYQMDVQNRRLERLKLFKERDIKVLIEAEEGLIKLGNEVLALLRQQS